MSALPEPLNVSIDPASVRVSEPESPDLPLDACDSGDTLADDLNPTHPDAAEVEAFLRHLIAKAQSLPTGSIAQKAMISAADDCSNWWLESGWRQFGDPTPIRESLNELYQIIGRRPHIRALRQAADSLERHLNRIIKSNDDAISRGGTAK